VLGVCRAEKKPLIPDLGNASVGKWLLEKNFSLSTRPFPNFEGGLFYFSFRLVFLIARFDYS